MLKVIDNFISERYSSYIFDKCAALKWTFVPDISLGSTAQRSVPGFSYNFYLHSDFNNNEPKTIETPEYSFIAPMLMEALDKFGLSSTAFDSLFRSRARLTLANDRLSEEEKIDNPHVDYKIPHLVLLYYVNSTDGDTVMIENNTVRDRIPPRRGRCILFDGSILHASSTPALGPRIVINNNIKLS